MNREDLEQLGALLKDGVGRLLAEFDALTAEAAAARAERDAVIVQRDQLLARMNTARQAFGLEPETLPGFDSVCERCGQPFMRKVGTSGRFCGRPCYETPPADDAAPTYRGKEKRVDVAGRQPDPFELNAECEVCTKGFHKNGPRQTVCRPCRKLAPRASVERLKEIYAGGTSNVPNAHIECVSVPCVGPALDGTTLCPLSKEVLRDPQARGPLRCPDCTLENRRRVVNRRLPQKRAEDRDLQERIERSAPPPPPIEDITQGWPTCEREGCGKPYQPRPGRSKYCLACATIVRNERQQALMRTKRKINLPQTELSSSTPAAEPIKTIENTDNSYNSQERKEFVPHGLSCTCAPCVQAREAARPATPAPALKEKRCAACLHKFQPTHLRDYYCTRQECVSTRIARGHYTPPKEPELEPWTGSLTSDLLGSGLGPRQTAGRD